MIVCGGLLVPPEPTLTCCLDLSPAGLIRVVSPFDAVTQSQLRRIKPRGRWNGAGQGWDFPLAAADALQQALGRRFPVTSSLQQWLDWCQQPLPPLPPHRTLVAAADLDEVLQDGRQPLRHQRSGVRWLLARRGAVLADEMGLGKTLTALLAARALMRCACLLYTSPSPRDS